MARGAHHGAHSSAPSVHFCRVIEDAASLNYGLYDLDCVATTTPHDSRAKNEVQNEMRIYID